MRLFGRRKKQPPQSAESGIRPEDLARFSSINPDTGNAMQEPAVPSMDRRFSGSPDALLSKATQESLKTRLASILYELEAIVDKTPAIDQKIVKANDMMSGSIPLDKGAVALLEDDVEQLQKMYGDIERAA